jgi:hypothetical protein
VPALVVGLVVYFFAGEGDGSGDGDTADVLEALISGGGGDTPSFRGKLPPGFPEDFPPYQNGEVTVSFLLESQQQGAGARYLVFIKTDDTAEEVYAYYTQELDKEPWQVEVARSSEDLTAMLFSRPDNPDIEGEVRVHQSDSGGDTIIYLTVDNVAASAASNIPEKPFALGTSRPLPPAFPSDIPIYKGKADSTIVLTQFGRGGGMNNFLVSFLTKDSDIDVLEYYRKEFQRRGWTVTDSAIESPTSGALGIDFTDGQRQEIRGSVSADSFEDDASYTRVDLELEVSARRGRGN